MELRFTVRAHISRPIATVFEAVGDPEQLTSVGAGAVLLVRRQGLEDARTAVRLDLTPAGGATAQQPAPLAGLPTPDARTGPGPGQPRVAISWVGPGLLRVGQTVLPGRLVQDLDRMSSAFPSAFVIGSLRSNRNFRTRRLKNFLTRCALR